MIRILSQDDNANVLKRSQRKSIEDEIDWRIDDLSLKCLGLLKYFKTQKLTALTSSPIRLNTFCMYGLLSSVWILRIQVVPLNGAVEALK